MFGIRVEFVFLAIVLVLSGLAYRDYWKSGRHWTPRARIWLRTALIFLAVTAWLLWV